MGRVRRVATLFIAALLLMAGLTATMMNSASAAPAGPLAAPAPVQLSYACALKTNGLLRYVTSTSKCVKAETPVTISPGPNYVCIHQDDLAYLVSSLNNCPVPKNKAALTLPPSSAPSYFCAVAIIGTLTYTTDPKKCLPFVEFPVVVPVPHTAPVLANIETTPLAYTGGSGPAQVTATMTVSSADAATLAGATVSISSGFVAAEDSLGFASQNGITGSYNAATGVLTLSGTASLANYQTALQSVTYADSNAQAATSTRTVSFQVNDGSAASNLSNTESRTVDVSPAPAVPPVIANVETTPLSYQAQSPAVAVTSMLTVSDSDATSLTGATVAITGGFDSGADSLAFANQNGITGSYDASTGVLTLTGTATVANYQAALRSVTFATSDAAASPAARTVSFTVTDTLAATSNTATRTIDVAAALQPPTAVNQSYSAVGNTALGVGITPPGGPAAVISGGTVLAGDSDQSSEGALSVTNITQPANGHVSMNANGTFSYLPSAGFTGTDTFQYTIAGANDPTETATATVTITVSALVWYVNDAAPGAGSNGESGNPFTTLAQAASAAGPNSIIFLYQGNATYAGGLAMKSGQALYGQPHGLTVGGYSLVAAGGAAPTITNTAGDGIDLASGADVENVQVSGASANGVNGTNVTGTVTLNDDVFTASGVNNGLITDASGSLTLNVTGSTFSANTGPSANYGLNVNANGSTDATVSVTGSTFTNNASLDFEFETGASATGTNSATFSDNSVTGGGGVEFGPFGDDATTITADGNNIQNPQVEGIGVDNVNESDTGGSVTGTISGNTVGSPTVANSGGGFGIGLGVEGTFTETLTVSNNKLYQYENDSGINFIDREGSPTMNLTVTGNTIADPGSFGSWGILGTAGALSTDGGTVCADITGNSIAGSGAAGQGGADVEIDQFGTETVKLPGYAGAATNDSAVATFLQSNNTGNGTPSAIATGGGFVNGTGC